MFTIVSLFIYEKPRGDVMVLLSTPAVRATFPYIYIFIAVSTEPLFQNNDSCSGNITFECLLCFERSVLYQPPEENQ